MLSRVSRVLFLALLTATAARVGAELPAGASRPEVEARYGRPSGVVQVGDRQILTYADRTVTLEAERVVEDLSHAGPGAAPRHSYVTTIPAKPVEWLTSYDQARKEADREGKRLLVLFWGETLPAWAPAFERAVVENHGLLRRLRTEFVLLKLHFPPAPQEEAGLNAIDAQKRADDLRTRAVGKAPLPGLAIVSADGRKVSPVSLEGAPQATDRLEFFTTRALERAKSGPTLTASLPAKALLLGAGVVSAVFILLRRKDP